MLVARATSERPAELWQVGLLAFALPDGIVGKGDESLPREVGSQGLPFGFALLRVAHGYQHPRIPSGFVGPVQVAGDMEARQALEEDFLDGVAVARNLSGPAGAERSGVSRKTAQDLQQFPPHELFPPLRPGFVADLGDGAFPPVKLLLGDTVQPEEKRIGRRRCRLAGQQGHQGEPSR
jgi:hypothetical protein